MRVSNPWARWAHRDDVRLDQRAGGSQAHRALDALSASQRCRRRCRRSGPRWERAAVARGRRATGSPRRPRTAPRRSGARSPPASRARRPRRPPYAPRAGPRSRRRRSRRASTAAQSSPVIPSHAHLPLRCLTATTTLSITMTTNARPRPPSGLHGSQAAASWRPQRGTSEPMAQRSGGCVGMDPRRRPSRPGSPPRR